MEGYLGQLILFAGNFAPRNWAICQGQLLSIANYTALYSILGTTYGGDGRTTFALPDLKGRVPVGAGTGSGLGAIALGQRGGAMQNTLNSGNLPSVPVKVSSANASQNVADAGASIATPGTTSGRTFTPIEGFNKATPDIVLNPATAGGNSTPVNNMQPFTGLNYIICLNGLYPSRS